ncbi:exodeoxyribonuclease V subunit alpha [Leptospira selangorensis]|uniref:RecBCD enzyme subunit RecD n=1 Tax=Leptospira selangorensis TaxID=2484982 RepID=A0A5F2C2Q7_9LEPT|nr:exodeoxyribonuclease V subunit alpha [Leptospira selangorensis]TGM13496.1 exodeoxyribonuclease V subunit alpha [Leptospira selangorensis]TGM22163.1 exodeoxyribonuclease V subunit alpha [Leptospira selangorensis]
MKEESLETILDQEYAGFLTQEFSTYAKEIPYETLFSWNLSLIQASKTGNLAVPFAEKTTISDLLFKKRDNLLYFSKIFNQLTAVEKGFENLLKVDTGTKSEKVQEVLKELIFSNPLSIKRGNKEYILCGEGEQKEALEKALQYQFFVLTGGPGTGKTTVVANVIRGLLRLGYDLKQIGLAAPTGRAAQRLKESLENTISNLRTKNELDDSISEIPTSTLHRLLEYNPRKRNYKYGKNFPLPYRVIILDEVSMVDLHMMFRLMEALPFGVENFRFILLGDPNQLPSVEAGAVLSDLVKSLKKLNSENLIELKTSHRQEEEFSSISKAAELCVKENVSLSEFQENLPKTLGLDTIFPGSRKEDLKGFYQIRLDYKKEWKEFLKRTAEDKILPIFSKLPNPNSPGELKEYLNKDLNRFKILTILRNGIFGSEYINKELTELILHHKKGNLVQIGTKTYFSGLPILITKNDRVRGVYNGDTGLVLEVQTPNGGSELRALFFIEGEIRDFALDTLPPHEPAFAITVHKSQGSEYDSIFIIYPPDPSDLNTEEVSLELFKKEILYTAITRAKRSAFLVSEEKLLEYSLRNRFERLTGFKLV